MRLIRSVLQRVNMSLYRQFQWGQVINTSKESVNSVLIKMHHLDRGSNIQWRGRSFAAPVPSDTPQGGNSRKRVSKDERRSMVENYVKKYREMKAGKFPTVTETKNDVGGGYYFIREILQELKYNSKISSIDTKDKNMVATKEDEQLTAAGEKLSSQKVQENVQLNNGDLLRNDLEEEKSFTEAKEVLSTQLVLDAPVSNADALDSSSSSVESKIRLQTSISHKDTLNEEVKLPVSDKSNDVETPSRYSTDELKGSPHSDAETNTKQETASEDEVKFDGLQHKTEPQQPTDSEQSGRELHKVPTKDLAPKKSSLWQNVKSFASGIFDIWRR